MYSDRILENDVIFGDFPLFFISFEVAFTSTLAFIIAELFFDLKSAFDKKTSDFRL